MLVLVTALVVVVAGAVGLVFKLIGGFFRFVFGGFRGGSRELDEDPRYPASGGNRRLCSDLNCRHANPWAAHYCAKCGRPLRR
jgi:hypothetical protein